jgi:hypothetical protein
MAYTARDLLTASLKRLGVLSGIEVPTADLAVDALDRLNALLEQWGTESLVVWAQTSATITPLVSSKAFYTIGDAPSPAPVADLIRPRPPWIESAWLVLTGTPTFEAPLDVLSDDDWQSERVKALTGTFPTAVYYRAAFPLAELWVWPVYTAGNATGITLWLPTPITTPVTLDTPLSMPPGYRRALRDELAVELGPELGREPSPTLRQLAGDAKAQLKRVNLRPSVLKMPAALIQGAYDWRVDR